MLLAYLINERAADCTGAECEHFDRLRRIEEETVCRAYGGVAVFAADDAGNTAFGRSLGDSENVHVLGRERRKEARCDTAFPYHIVADDRNDRAALVNFDGIYDSVAYFKTEFGRKRILRAVR